MDIVIFKNNADNKLYWKIRLSMSAGKTRDLAVSCIGYTDKKEIVNDIRTAQTGLAITKIWDDTMKRFIPPDEYLY